MKALFIGGTGTISTSICKLLLSQGWDLTLLNRGQHQARLADLNDHITQITADIADVKAVEAALDGQWFDVIANFIVFTPQQAERDIRLFSGKCGQYIFISSASAYQKPPVDQIITESTPLSNPYWTYSQNKIECETLYMEAFRAAGFPVTIIRPSHTYAAWAIPLSIHGEKGPWQTIQRMLDGKPVVVHGDGTSLWTVTHSQDLAIAFAGLMANPHAIGQAFHITSDEALSWNQIYDIIGQAFGVKAKIVHITTDELISLMPDLIGPLWGDKAHCAVFDNSKVKRLVPDYRASIRFDEGMRMAAAYFDEHPELQQLDPEWDIMVEKLCQDRPVSGLSLNW